MMKVTGYMTSKGEFFRDQRDCEEQEALDIVMDHLKDSLYEDQTVIILQAVRAYPRVFERLAKAHIAIEEANHNDATAEPPPLVIDI